MPPAVFLALAAYFAWSATQGDRGLQASVLREQDKAVAALVLKQTQDEVAMWERRVAALKNGRLDPDALDERARAMLNLSEPDDIVLQYGPGKRLFP